MSFLLFGLTYSLTFSFSAHPGSGLEEEAFMDSQDSSHSCTF
jgi:hypothetical protein